LDSSTEQTSGPRQRDKTAVNRGERDGGARLIRLFSEKFRTEGEVVKRARWWLAGWAGVIVLVVCPWTSFQAHSHWEKIAWVPFLSPDDKLRDIVVNVLLYIPGGYFGARAIRDGARRIWIAMAFAAALSLVTEASQLYSHGRFPSATDFTCNVLGAFAGARFARRNSSMIDD
jgi:hypothetical protein